MKRLRTRRRRWLLEPFRYGCRRRYSLWALVPLVFFCLKAAAQESVAEKSGTLEEVVVVAPPMETVRDILSEMRAAIIEAEDAVFEVFNEVNTDDDYSP
jgi:hypothetical protein